MLRKFAKFQQQKTRRFEAGSHLSSSEKTIAKAVERSLGSRNFFSRGGGVIIAIVIKIFSARGGDSARARDSRGEMSKRGGTVEERGGLAGERSAEYPDSRGGDAASGSSSARQSAIIGAVACARRRTIDSSECKLLTRRSLFSPGFPPSLLFFLSYRLLSVIAVLEAVTFFLECHDSDWFSSKNREIRASQKNFEGFSKDLGRTFFFVRRGFMKMISYNTTMYWNKFSNLPS